MRKQNIILRGVISLWVTVSLLMTPLAPALAASVEAAAQAVHARHAVADMAGAHADHGKAHPATKTHTTDRKGVSCEQHDRCSGQCCATCAQCFTATPALPAIFLTTHTPQLSAVPRLHDRLVVAGHDRPPAA